MNVFYFLVLFLAFGWATATDSYLFIGSRSSDSELAGIYSAKLSDGQLTTPSREFPLKYGATLELNHRRDVLYASESAGAKNTGMVIALKVLPGGDLVEINRVDSGVDHFCSLAVSKDGRYLIGTSFGLGVVSCFRLAEDGEIQNETSRITLPRFPKGNKVLARAHDAEITDDGRFVFVTDIANNRLYTFTLDSRSGLLEQKSFITSDSFEGPRHLILNKDETCVYILNQKGSSIVVFGHDGEGSLVERQSISTLPSDYEGKQNHSAEILIHPSQKFLYASNRNHDHFSSFQVSETGTLTKVQSIGSGGESPWSFVLNQSGSHLIGSNLKTSNLIVFEIDQKTGVLTRTQSEVEIPEPVSLVL